MPVTPTTPPKKVSLVLADVDGTLVTQEKVLTERAIQAVQKLRDKGIAFAITSGRPPKGMAMLTGPLALTTPIAAFNGGLLVKPDTMEVMEQHVLPNDLVPQIIATMEANDLDVWLYRGADWFVRDKNAPHVDRESRTVQFAPTVVPNFDGLLDNLAKIVGVSDDLQAVARGESDAQNTFGAHVSAARSQPYYLDVTHPDANKGAVARRFCELLKIPKEELVTLGDQPNDVRMFKESGFSVAMGNAPDDVKHAASVVTDSNENEGLAQALEKYILHETDKNQESEKP